MLRVIAVILLLPSCLRAQPTLDARAARPLAASADCDDICHVLAGSALHHRNPASIRNIRRSEPVFDQPADTGTARANRIGRFALGGVIVGAAVMAVAERDKFTKRCEDFCLIPPRAEYFVGITFGAGLGGLLGAGVGALVTR